MKPTIEQVTLCNFISSIVKTWINTNDINSPTHLNDINDFVEAELDQYKEIFRDRMVELLIDLYWEIRMSPNEIEYLN